MLKNITITLSILLLFMACKEEETATPVTADFEYAVLGNDHSVPVAISIENLSFGADSYQWTFVGATPALSTDFNPGTITYEQQGTYNIQLIATNGDGCLDSLTRTVTVDSSLVVSFTASIEGSHYPPVSVSLTNTSSGVTNYEWAFENANIASSTLKTPEAITFETEGVHVIRLTAGNDKESLTAYDTIWVDAPLTASFDYEVASLADEDLQAPVTLNFTNTSTSWTSLQWTFEGGDITETTTTDPTVTFGSAGTYEVVLQAANDKTTDSDTVSITIAEDTNLRTFENIQLGINTAHSTNTLGAFFSTTNQTVYTADQVDETSLIDIAFFGLNDTFVFNKFVSPDEVRAYTFEALANATHTQFINRQESCLCESSMTLETFDSMLDDSALAALTITETHEGLQEFDHTVLPRIVLFETAAGKKGAIKINGFVIDAAASYIVVEIKVQKIGR